MMNVKNLRRRLTAAGGGVFPTTREQLFENAEYRAICEACGNTPDHQPIPGAKNAGVSLSDWSIREAFAELVTDKSGQPVGHGFISQYLDPREGGRTGSRHLWESGGAMGAVNTGAFMDIQGQFLVVNILQQFQREEFKATRMFPVLPTPLKEEKIPGVARPKDAGKRLYETPEGERFKTVGFGSQWVQTPLTRKFGIIIPLTKEVIYFDLTGQVVKMAGEGAYNLGLDKEKWLLDVMIGAATDIPFIEKRQDDAGPLTLDLFQLSGAGSGSGQLAYAFSSRLYPFVNDIPGNPLNDWKAVELSDRYFSKVPEPNTGEPIVIGGTTVFASETRRMALYRIARGTRVVTITQAGITTVGSTLTDSPNPISEPGAFDYDTSRLLRARLVAQIGSDDGWTPDNVWFRGNPQKAFAFMENWPLTTVQAPPNSEAEFYQDIVLQWKSSYRGTPAILEPRAWQRNNYTSAGSGV